MFAAVNNKTYTYSSADGTGSFPGKLSTFVFWGGGVGFAKVEVPSYTGCSLKAKGWMTLHPQLEVYHSP